MGQTSNTLIVGMTKTAVPGFKIRCAVNSVGVVSLGEVEEEQVESGFGKEVSSRCLREYRFTRGSPDQSIIRLFLFVL